MFTPQKPRRLRKSSAIRDLVCETNLQTKNLVFPLFVKEALSKPIAISSMPGLCQHSLASVLDEVGQCVDLGLTSFLLFGIPAQKDSTGSTAFAAAGITQKTIDAIKTKYPHILLIADVCLCEYTSHGHCGILTPDGQVENDATCQQLAKVATSYAQAGADIVAPSDMMDGRIGVIRKALDSAGYDQTPLLSYAVKYASSFYGPFREAAESTPQFGDRKTYQMDVANWKEALREAKIDEDEGADILMVKPAMSCLDIISRLSQQTHLPLAAYQVSGEFAMIEAAAKNGWIDRERAIWESLISIRRAGAQIVVTYFAKEMASRL